MSKPKAPRHDWNENDACNACGMQRSGHSGGRTGSMNYYTADGNITRRAGPCIPGPPMQVESALRRAEARRGK